MKRFILLSIIAGFIGIQGAAFIDDPEHFFEPDPDCPICLAVQNPVCIQPHVSIQFTPDIILYLPDLEIPDPSTYDAFSSLSIRAPPFI